VWGANIIEQYPIILNLFGWLVITLLLGLGIYYFFKPYQEKMIKPSAGAGFMKGFMLAIFNPQLFPFWLAVLVYIKGYVDFRNGSLISPYVTFVIGTCVGAWLLLFLFTKLAISYKEKLTKILRSNLNKIVGSLFIILALIELIRKILSLV
jgi:threonine/homoserine/homoserine lactone efflux protein